MVVENDLISRSELLRIVYKDMYDMVGHHKDGKSRGIHMGEYRHFLKRIAEQEIVKVRDIDLMFPNEIIEELTKRGE